MSTLAAPRQRPRTCTRHRRYLLASCPVCASEVAQIAREATR